MQAMPGRHIGFPTPAPLIQQLPLQLPLRLPRHLAGLGGGAGGHGCWVIAAKISGVQK